MLEDFFEFGLDCSGYFGVDGLLEALLEGGVVGKFCRSGDGGVLDELGAVIHAFSEEDFRTLVNETIKVQQASLNVMKMIAKAVC